MAGAGNTIVLTDEFSGGLKLFTSLKPRPPLAVDAAALRAIMGTTSSSIMAAGTGRSYTSYVGTYLAFATAMKAPYAAGCVPGVPVTFSVLMAFCVWYVAVKPNRQHPGKPHAAKSLNAAFSALKAAARVDNWNRTESNGESHGGGCQASLSRQERDAR